MAEHVWTVLCRATLLDSNSGVLSLSDITELLTLTGGAGEDIEAEIKAMRAAGHAGMFWPVRLRLVSWWVRTDLAKAESEQVRVAMIDPAGEAVSTQSITVNLVDYTSQRINLGLNWIPINAAGRYWFVVEHQGAKRKKGRWIKAAAIPLEVVFGKTEEASASIAPAPPSGRSPAAPPASSSQSAPSPPSNRPGARGRRQRRG
jgi:hypothetical protein